MKKLFAILLAAVMTAGMTACSGSADNDSTSAASEDTTFTLRYPESMKAQGYEDLVLEDVPERIACTVTASVLTMHEMGASLVGMPSSAATKGIAAENPDITVLPSIMSDEFNTEAVMALNPDLVVINSMYADSHGATMESLGVPVYYIGAGHGVGFESVREESMLFIDAFSVDEESTAKGEELKQKFEEIEKTCTALRDTYKDKKIMVLQLGGVDMVYGQTSAGTLGSMMKMLGFENVADATASASMFQIDYETALVEQPDLLVVCSSGDAAATEALVDEVIASNPEYWNAMNAIAEDQILCLGIEYIAVYGIGYVDALGSLIEDVDAFYAE
ncbi:MAG: ABC transporter substrate-binding protein [Clostridia bacterium]|nr:ABC transporter substrate-binding protein [Clostridia bacterium]MBQ8185810.1 ABC transporter substrate-binding protein [Clostridia bacterium]